MKKSVLLVLTVMVFFILSGFTVYPEGNLNSEFLLSGNIGESGLSYKYEDTIGTPNKPYIFSSSHINQPQGLYVDSEGALYVTETDGSQVLKYDSSGVYERSFGAYGQPWHHDNFLSEPRSAIVSDNGHVFVAYLHAIKEYDQDGNVIRIFPEENQWESGSDNEHFDEPFDLVFNEDESLLFVSDNKNHRVQIFSFDSDGNFVYVETISDATADMLDGGFNSIRGLDMDSSGRLYVVDFLEHVVQRCEKAEQWQCSDFIGTGGTSGADLNHLDWPVDVYIDQHDAIFIVDGSNYRVLNCDVSGVCTNFLNLEYGSENNQYTWLNGITGDSSGNIYVSDKDNFRVQVFDSTGEYLRTYGTTGVPYLTDENYLNTPAGIALDSDGSIVIVEHLGRRLIKYDANGNILWQVGEAGVWGDDNAHFGAYWTGTENNPAIDKDHNIYVADSGNHRIQIFDQNGNLIRSFGSYGQGAAQFDYPTHIFIDQSTDNIYVTDSYNHRVQIFNSNFSYKDTIGVTGEAGSDNIHFLYPQSVVMDADGYVYVADFDNNRVQKCKSHNGAAYTCETFIGETGVHNGNLGQVYPYSIATDQEGRFYISDRWAGRIQIFDSKGAFLTSIEGNHSAEVNDPMGLAVNEDGLLYVANKGIHAIHIYSPGIPDWKQSNINGFGDNKNVQIPALATFKGQLYAGTRKDGETSTSEVWRTADGSKWEKVDERQAYGCYAMAEFKGYLYCTSYDGWIWRSENGKNWTDIMNDGFRQDQTGVFRLAVYKDFLYANTWSDSGVEIWRTSDGLNWNIFAQAGLNGDEYNETVRSDVIYNGYFYLGVHNTMNGAQLWKTDGDTLTKVSDDLGSDYYYAVSALSSYNGYLYAALASDWGVEVIRSKTDSNWETVITMSDVGSSANGRVSLEVNQGELFLVARNNETGVEVWKTENGTKWTQIGFEGFSDSNNQTVFYDNSVTTFKNKLFIGATNFVNGGEVWQYDSEDYSIYLPIILNKPTDWYIVASPTTNSLNAVKMSSANQGWSVGNSGTIIRWNGSSWSAATSPTTNNLNDLYILDANDAWSVGDSGTILRWNGSTWNTYSSPTNNNLNGIYMLNRNDGWIVGNSGTILHWNGTEWKSWSSPTETDLFALDFLTNDFGWATGGWEGFPPGSGSSEMLRWDGNQWTDYPYEHSFHAVGILYDIDIVSSTFGIARGYNNNGEIWNGWYWHWYLPAPALQVHYGVSFLTDSDGWSVGWTYPGNIILHWNGNVWEEIIVPVNLPLKDITMLDSTHGWIVGDEGTILRYGN